MTRSSPARGHADRLWLNGLSVECIVGVYTNERRAPQPLGVDLCLCLDTRAAARDAKLSATVDYARLWGEVRFLMQASRFTLLESAAEAVASYILAAPTSDAPRARVEEVCVRLSKPLALAGAGVPTLEIHRRAADYSYPREEKPFGHTDLIFATRGCGIYRGHINPGATIPAHVHRGLDEAELVLGQGLLVQGKPAAVGTGRHWPRGFVHRWDNPTDEALTFLCVHRPACTQDEAIEVMVPLDPLSDVEAIAYFTSP